MAQSDLYNTEVENSEPDFSFYLKPTEVGGKPLKRDSEPTFFRGTDLEEPVERNETALQDVVTAVKKGVVGLGQMASGIGALYRYPTQNISKSLAETQENLSKEFSSEGERQKQIVDSTKGFVPSIGAYLENPRALAMAGAESLPGTILGMGPSAAMAKNIFKEAMQKSLAESASGLAAGTITKQQAVTMAREAGKQAIGDTSKMALIAPSAAAEGVQTSGMIADQAQEAGRAHSEFSGPAVLGGVTTAGINLASGKMFGDIATDVATGAKTVGAGSKVGKVLKGTATEAGEENLQSGQEQVNTNIALGKENIFEGVPEAMGAGTVLGGAMGGAFGSVGVVSDAIKAIGGDKPNAGIATRVATEALVNNVADPAKVVGQTPDSSTGGVAAGIDPTGEPPKPNTGSGAASRVAKASSTAAPITEPSATTEGSAPSTEPTPTTQAEAVPTQTAQPQIEAPTDQTLGEVVPHPEHEGVTSAQVVSLEDQRRELYQKLADIYTNATGAERFTVLRTKSPDSPEYQVASAAHNVAYATKIQDKLSTIADTVSKSEPLKSSQRTQLSSMMANLGVSDTGDVKSNVDAVNSAVTNIYDRAAKVYRGEVEAPAVQEAPAKAPAKAPAVQEAPAKAPAVQEFVPATPDTPIDFAAQNFAADAVTNNIPTDIDPANNQKANSNFQGIPVAIETPKGSERYWKTPDGLIGGSNTQTAHYGEIPKTEGFDNDPVDVFIPDQLTKEDILNTKSAFIIDQINPETGYFDEHKVVLGVKSADEALALYKSNYDPDWKGAKAIHEMPIDQFKTWVFDKNNTVRPLDPNIPLDPQNEVKNVQSQNATTQETNAQEQVETPQPLVEGTDLSSQTVSEPEEFDEAFAAFEPDSRTESQSSLFGKLRNLQEAFNKGRAEYAATKDKSSLEGVQTATLQQLSELTDSNTASRLTAYLMDSGFTDGDVYWLDNEDVQRVVNDMSYDKLLSEREAALDSSVNKIEQVNDAIEAKTPKKSRLTPLANDKIAEYADDLRAMASKAGWAEVGGKLLRDANGVAVWRTKWIPNADWYKEVENRLGAQQTVAAVEKAINQQPMTAKEKRAVESMINYLYFTIEENLTETQAVHAEKLTQLYELAKSIDEKLNTNFYDAVLREDALTSDDINEWTGDLYDYYARYSKSDTGGQEVANVETESRSDQPAKNDTGKPVATSRSATIAPAISKYLNGTAVVKVRSAGAEGFRLFVDDVAVADVPEFVIGKEDTTRALLNAYREALVAEGVQLKNDSDLEGVLAHLKSQIAQNSVSQQDAGSENLSEDEARAILVENFGLGINRLFNQGILNFGFPSHLTKAINNKAEGAYVRSEGKAYLNLRVLSKDRLVPVVLHEVGEHYGLLKMIGEKEYRNLLNQIRNLAKIKGSEAERVWNAVKKQYTGIEQEGSDRFVSEVIARLGENNPRLPWYRRLLSKVKAFLIRIGIGRGFIRGTLSENDIHDLLRASLFSSVNSTEDVSTYGAQEQPAYSEDLNDVERDRLYLEAVKSGDMETAEKMVVAAAKRAGVDTFANDSVNIGYKLRRTAPPKKTVKVYKAFRMRGGRLYPMFVGAQNDLPIGQWLDATEGGYRFKAENGRWYVPADTGDSIDIPNSEVAKELFERGYIKSETNKGIKAVAYRPGWHGGELPFFPQAGRKVKHRGKVLISQAPSDYAYMNVHEFDTVIAEVEMDADYNYRQEFLDTAEYNKDGTLNKKLSGLRNIPEGGYYEYATNPLFEDRPDLGKWFISGSVKINRVLSQGEVNKILDDLNVPRQLWMGGEERIVKRATKNSPAITESMGRAFDELNLEDLGYDPQFNHLSYKLLDPVTYDKGEIIPLSKRFDLRSEDPRYSTSYDREYLAPNGKPSNLNKMQWHQVRTPEFKQWFGDWENDPENASKVIDENGEPLVVYHGTDVDFTKFNSKSGVYWFTDDELGANSEGTKLINTYLSIKKPYFWSVGDREPDAAGVKEKLTSNGYDGVIAPSNIGNVDYITFEPNQIKSATGNTGAFSTKNNDIRYSVQPVDNIFEMRRQPLFDSSVFLDKLITAKEAAANFYSDVKSEGYRKALTNAVFSKTTAALGVYRMTDSVKHVLPGLKKFQDLIDTRRGFIDKLMHDFNYAVDKWGHEELKEHRELLNATMQESTMDDVNASLDWSGVMDASYLRDVADNDVHKFSEIRANQKRTTAYTQASLGNHFGNRILVEARKAGAISSTKYSATFDTEQKALKFLDTIRKIEQDMIVSSGGSDTNAKRKAVHARVKRSYDSLPLKAQAIYELVHAQLERSNRLRLEALEDRISESILEGKRRSAAISSLRKAFESNALKWYYAPLGRFGDYWFYAEMDDGERHFQTFDSQHALDKGVSQFTEDNPTAKLLGQGMKMDALGKDVSGPHTTDAFLTELFTVLQEANLDADTYKQITDEVYQRYLAQLPEISMRHRSQHRTGTRGYEKDQLKSTAFALHHSANQIGNMLYGSKMVDVLKDAVQAIKMAQRDDIFANAERELENLVKFADLVKSHNGSAFDAIEDLKLDRRELKAELKQAKADGLDTEYLEQEISDLDELISFTDSFKDLSIDEIHPAIKKRMGSYKSSLDQAKRLRRLPDELPWARDVVKELALTQQHITAPVSSSLDGVAQNLRGLSYIFTLGFSISSALVNLLQTIVVAIPVSYGYFTQLGSKRTLAMYGEVFKYGMEAFATWNGAKDADGNRSLSEVFRRLESEARDAKSAERYRDLREALEIVKMNGDISRSMTWDLIAYGNEGEHVDTAMQGVGKMMGSLFYGAERINREITFVANYALAREQFENDTHSKTGSPLTSLQKRAKAVSISRELTRDAHGDYSPDSSARMFRGPIAAVALQFKKYPVMMYVMWGKNFMGFMNRNKWQDLPETTPEEIEYKAKRRTEAKQATRTFTALLGAQAAFAGAYSLPLSSTISAAATAVMWTVFQALKALGLKDDDDEDVDFQRWVHVSIAQHFGETAATLVTKGVVNASTPINLSSRTDLSSVFFREPLEDLKGEDLSRYYMSQIFGVAGGVANNVMEGMSQISQGREVRGVEMMLPKFLKDAVKTYRYADEGATSRSGIPVADVGTSELVLQLLGFGSSNLDVAFTERGYAKNAETQLTDRRTAIKARIVKDIMDGAKPDLEELRGWNKRHPEWPIGSKDIHASIKSKLKHRSASEGRGYEVNPKLDYLYDKYRIRD